MKAPTNLDLYLGSPVLPSQVRRVRTDHRGALSLSIESEDHDRGLLRSLASAVRDDGDVVAHLHKFADLMDALDAAEREGDSKLRRSLEDEANDVVADIEASMEWQNVGEPHVAALSTKDTERLVDALTGQTEPVAVERSVA